MTITRKDLVTAVFWEVDLICLDCGTPLTERMHFCPECQSTDIINPEFALRVLEKVEVEDGQD